MCPCIEFISCSRARWPLRKKSIILAVDSRKDVCMIRIAIAGAAGRMGRALIEAAAATTDLKLSAAIEEGRSTAIGADAGMLVGSGSLGVAVGTDLGASDFDVLIDFTQPEPTLAHLAYCVKTRKK